MREITINYSPDKYYGMINLLNRKGFITRDEFENGCFKFTSCDFLTNGNYYSKDISLNSLILSFIKSNCKVYEFDTYQELFLWLAKEED